jgi:hypothetical protein
MNEITTKGMQGNTTPITMSINYCLLLLQLHTERKKNIHASAPLIHMIYNTAMHTYEAKEKLYI